MRSGTLTRQDSPPTSAGSRVANRRIVGCGTPGYPSLLAAIADAPLALFVEGEADVLGLPQLAMVGARNPRPRSAATPPRCLPRTSRAPDSRSPAGSPSASTRASHRGALAGKGRTVAVQGRGPDRIYPAEHAELAREIAAQGALVTEFPTGVPPLPEHFPRRNRIISGLAMGTLVVEAALAQRLADHRPPRERAGPRGVRHSRLDPQPAVARVSSPDPPGCKARRERGRHIHGTRSPSRWSWCRGGSFEAPDGQAETGRALDKEYEILLDALGFEPASVDALVSRTGLRADAVASMLLILELEGQVEQQHGGVFCRKLPGKQE